MSTDCRTCARPLTDPVDRALGTCAACGWERALQLAQSETDDARRERFLLTLED